jgi:N6-L-threonylcarbamoyladenine synthase
MSLVVSGGHTHLYRCEQTDGAWRYRNVGKTVDDAAGEAFDKVAKLLGLGYPGGPWIDELAKHGEPRAVEFRFQPIKRRRAHPTRDNEAATDGAPDSEASFDFSFSGIKTAVLRYIETHGMRERAEVRRVRLGAALKERPALRAAEALVEIPELFDRPMLDLIASFQYAVVGNLLKQTFGAAEVFGACGVVVSGGVAANSELRRRFTAEADRRGLPVAFPTMAMSTDNAAMIAAAGWGKFVAGKFAGDELVAVPQLRLG